MIENEKNEIGEQRHDGSGTEAAPRLILLTRHPGAVQWLQRKLGNQSQLEIVAHLEHVTLKRNDRVYGIFPMHLAAHLCTLGVECWMIDVVIPATLRGVELSAEQLNQLGAELVRYEVRRAE